MGSLMLEVGGRKAQGGADGRLWIAKGGLEEWWDSAETTFEEQQQPDQHGAFDPVNVYVGPRRFTVRLLAFGASPEWAETDIRTWAASLSAMPDIKFRVYHAGRWLSLRNAKIRGKVRVTPNRQDMRLTDIEFVVWSADPRKYGDMRRITVDARLKSAGGLTFPIVPGSLDFAPEGAIEFPGAFSIPNHGTAEFYPILTMRGSVGGFTVTSDGRVIEYSAPVPANKPLVLSPYAGGRAVLDGVDVSHNLTRAEWVPVRGGETRNYVLTPVSPLGGSQLIIEYPDGAYW